MGCLNIKGKSNGKGKKQSLFLSGFFILSFHKKSDNTSKLHFLSLQYWENKSILNSQLQKREGTHKTTIILRSFEKLKCK